MQHLHALLFYFLAPLHHKQQNMFTNLILSSFIIYFLHHTESTPYVHFTITQLLLLSSELLFFFLWHFTIIICQHKTWYYEREKKTCTLSHIIYFLYILRSYYMPSFLSTGPFAPTTILHLLPSFDKTAIRVTLLQPAGFGLACVVSWHLVSVRTFGVMYDYTF